MPPPGYLQGVRELCTRHGIVFIADEVMSGFGRTGTWFAVEHFDVVPDLLTFAKGRHRQPHHGEGRRGTRRMVGPTFGSDLSGALR